MKKILFFVLAVIMFAACSKDAINEQQNMQTIVDEAPETLVVGFEESDETRIQLNEDVKTVWTNGDQVSVFYRSDANQKWQYTGETGARIADLIRVDEGVATEAMKRVVVVYPYNEGYYINIDTFNVQATLPAVQSYLKDSYGLNGNIMISQGEYNNISLKSVCGWLKLQLTGNGEKVKSITLKGNNGEQVAGELYINSADATAILSSDAGNADDGETGGAGGGLVFEDAVLKEVVLDCGEGVELGAEATVFYIALPPQTFEQGLTVNITDDSDFTMTQATEKSVVIARNTIQPMSAFKFVNPNTPTQPTPASNEIWYTADEKVEPFYGDYITFGANIVTNVYDSGSKKGVITFDENVTLIGESAFQNCSKLESITLPSSISKIMYNAFNGCVNLKYIDMGDGVQSVDAKSFYGCNKLSKFIGKYAEDNGRIIVIAGKLVAFAPSEISEYAIPNYVVEIGESVFNNCDSLQTIVIGDSVNSINAYAFYDCNNLKEVILGNNLSIIGSYAFSYCRSLINIQIPNSVKIIGNRAFENCTSLTSVTIGSQVTSIGYYAFSWCTSLKTVYCNSVVPSKLEMYSVPYSYVFRDNASGRRIYVYEECLDLYKTAWNEFSSSIYSVGQYPNNGDTTTFYYTTSDEQIINISTVAIKRNEYIDGIGKLVVYGKIERMPNDMFKGCNTLTSIVIPDYVNKIGQSAFESCTSLVDITIPNSVNTIEWGAFSGCWSLKSIDIPNSVHTIGAYAFEDCYALENITIPETVKVLACTFKNCCNLSSFTIHSSITEISMYTFYGCSKLTCIIIPESVNKIGYQSFAYCTSLKDVYCMPTTPPDISWISYEWQAFIGNASGRKIYVPVNSVDAYKNAKYWSDYADSIVGYDFNQ